MQCSVTERGVVSCMTLKCESVKDSVVVFCMTLQCYRECGSVIYDFTVLYRECCSVVYDSVSAALGSASSSARSEHTRSQHFTVLCFIGRLCIVLLCTVL